MAFLKTTLHWALGLGLATSIVATGFAEPIKLKWHHSYAEALAEAEQKKKPIFLAFR